ncbi:MAG: ABC transporter substrate-binding protein [Deltaproteobacteria bacterium]|nr:MAG: ABC transporter substrate-binding protein [Deltaproteobacteria bacterium]
MSKNERIHPAIYDLKVDLDKGKLTRRDFLRYATLLGMSAFAASQMAGLVWPKKALAAKPVRGGVLKVAGQVQKITHPSQFSWVAPTQVARQVGEYLTFTDGKNITHPYLLKNWEVSKDLKTWTLNLRQGIKWNNGDTFMADDVIFTFNQWMSKDVGSSMLGLVGEYLDLSGIEKVDQYQVKLHLKKPEIAVPEHLFHYPALVLNHKTFDGDFIKKPVGTGPYTLESYLPGERAVIKRRNDYWQKGADGKPLPYMDGMEFIDMGTEMAPQIAAIKAGEIDMIDLGDVAGVDVFQALRNDPNIQMIPVTSASTRVLRMRVDMKPWDNNKVRTALKICQHHEKLLALVYFNEGLQGQDFHVYQLHPEYCEKPIPKYDPKRAKKLLKEAGYPKGIDVTLAVGTWPDVVRYAEVLKQDAAPAGFRINIQTMPTSQYWEKWTEVDLGITPWMHRPIGTMVLNLAYIADDQGKPVPWNETRWSDPEFSKLLNEANGLLNVDERRKVFCKLEDIQQQRGSIGIPYWRNAWYCLSKKVKNVHGVPSLYMTFNDAWLEA